MLCFFDTEFTQLRKDTTLISIGFVTETNEQFYAEFSDYNKSLVNDWIKENVIKNLICTPNIERNREVEPDLYFYGNKTKIRKELLDWLSGLGSDIQFVSDVCHYDMVLLIDLLGKTAFDLPDYINPVCHDINQDIAKFYSISEREAFNMNREQILGIKENGKHNSLVDAIVIKDIYYKIKDHI